MTGAVHRVQSHCRQSCTARVDNTQALDKYALFCVRLEVLVEVEQQLEALIRTIWSR